MRIKRPKLLIFLFYELGFYSISCLAAGALSRHLAAPPEAFSYELALVLSLFFVLYFYQMWRDLYSRDYHYYLRNTYPVVVRNMALSVLPAVAAALLLRIHQPRLVPVVLLYLIMGVAGFTAMHGSQYLWVRYLSGLGYFRKNILVIGNPDERLPVGPYFRDIGSLRTYAGRIFFQDDRWFWQSAGGKECRPLTGLQQVRSIILRENIGEVLLFLGQPVPEELLLGVVTLCQKLSIGYYLVPDIQQIPNRYPWNRVFPYIPVLERFSGSGDSLTAISVKRLLDIAVALLSVLLLLPLCILIAAAVKLEDGGPVFYVSTRVGKNGRSIRFYKFRTMRVGADRQKAALLQFNERGDGPLFKMKNDPRVTTVGRLLRKHSLDELPQMLNVLLGNMSLVGPRPHLPEEVAVYRGSDYLRLECMPGIVGLPQVVGRNTLGFREWVDLDLQYRSSWSLTLDLRIMARTVGIVVNSFVARTAAGY